MASDSSVYNQLGANVVQPVNPLALQAQMYQAANSAMSLQGQVAKRAAGEAFQQSITPDGGTDQAALLRNLAANPQAAMSAQESAAQGQGLSANEFDLHQKRISGVIGGFAALIAQNPTGVPLDQIQGYVNDQVNGKFLTPSEGQEMLARYGQDPVQNTKKATVGIAAGMDAQAALNQARPAPGYTDVGGVLKPTGLSSRFSTGPMSIGPAPGTAMGKSVTPEFASGQDSEIDPTTGKSLAVSRAERMSKQGNGALLPPGAASNGLPPGLVPPGYTGRYSPSAAQQQPSNTASNNSPNTVVTGLAPGVADAAAIAAKGGAEQGAALQRSADDTPNRLAILGNMESDLEGFTSGPGASQERQYGAFVGRYAPGLAKSFGLDPQTVASSENFAKLSKQIILQQAGTLGVGTDQKLMTSMGGNPNDDLSKLGNKQVVALMKGNEDAIGAKAKAWQTYKQSNGIESDYGQFQNKFNENFDPRFFQAMRMSLPDRQRMFNTIPAKEQDAFKAKFRDAVKSGMLSVPTGG